MLTHHSYLNDTRPSNTRPASSKTSRAVTCVLNVPPTSPETETETGLDATLLTLAPCPTGAAALPRMYCLLRLMRSKGDKDYPLTLRERRAE